MLAKRTSLYLAPSLTPLFWLTWNRRVVRNSQGSAFRRSLRCNLQSALPQTRRSFRCAEALTGMDSRGALGEPAVGVNVSHLTASGKPDWVGVGQSSWCGISPRARCAQHTLSSVMAGAAATRDRGLGRDRLLTPECCAPPRPALPQLGHSIPNSPWYAMSCRSSRCTRQRGSSKRRLPLEN